MRRHILRAGDGSGRVLPLPDITTGALTGKRSAIVSDNREGVVCCSNSAAFAMTLKAGAGSGVAVAQGNQALLLAWEQCRSRDTGYVMSGDVRCTGRRRPGAMHTQRIPSAVNARESPPPP